MFLLTSDHDIWRFDSITPHHYSRGFYRENLIKQTYSVFVETPRGRRKWHLSRFSNWLHECTVDMCWVISVAYFTQESLEFLHTIDDIPGLSSLHVPPGKYKSARSAKNGKSSASPVYEPLAISSFPDGSHTLYPSRRQLHTAPTYYNPAFLDTSRRPSMTTIEPSSPRLRSPSSTDRRRVEILAPLAYLQNIPPPRRHPLDEEALMSFTGLHV